MRGALAVKCETRFSRVNSARVLRVHLVIEDLELRKLSTFSIDRAKMSLIGPTIAINISIPEIHATGFYNISGILGDMYSLHGAGSFKTNVYDFRVYVNTVLGYARGVYMKRFDLDFSLRAIKINLENFMGGEEIGQIMSKVSIVKALFFAENDRKGGSSSVVSLIL